jgi:hypothetical protein
MTSVNLNDDNVYINGLTINGNLVVKGTLFMAHDNTDCPSELLETNNKDVVYDKDTTFEGNLHILPKSNLTISGAITSGELHDRY